MTANNEQRKHILLQLILRYKKIRTIIDDTRIQQRDLQSKELDIFCVLPIAPPLCRSSGISCNTLRCSNLYVTRLSRYSLYNFASSNSLEYPSRLWFVVANARDPMNDQSDRHGRNVFYRGWHLRISPTLGICILVSSWRTYLYSKAHIYSKLVSACHITGKSSTRHAMSHLICILNHNAIFKYIMSAQHKERLNEHWNTQLPTR